MSETSGAPTGGFERRPVRLAGAAEDGDWGIAVEVPVEIGFNGTPWTVMLATPCDIEDLAVGLALTERLIDDAGAIEQIQVSSWLGEIAVDLKVAPGRLSERLRDRRSLAANSGCGLCGLESLAAFHHRHQAVSDRVRRTVPEIGDQAIKTAFAALPDHQPINRDTRSVHAAAWCHPSGRIIDVREDVGRHNALDKLIGARARQQQPRQPGFVVMTSRCSYELVAKAAAAEALLLATISAPTTLALTWSQTLGVPLACTGPGGRIVRFPQEMAHVAD